MTAGTKAVIAAMALSALAVGSVAAQVGVWVDPEGPPATTLKATLVAPPGVPPAIDRSTPARVVVELVTTEQKGTLADGVEYTFWTFGGSVPGPMLRVRQGDTVEMRLTNRKDSHLTHSIDLHAVTGSDGGAAVTQVMPGQTSVFEWKALNPGLYVYHCATPHVTMHIANGMYGMVLVEPTTGLPTVDREYYVMQGEFYTAERTLTPGPAHFDMAKTRDERPEYVVFNGRVGALLEGNALTASAGEVVRLYVGNGGPNLVSSFHVIGEIFDRVWSEAALPGEPRRNLQTTLIPPGGAAIVELRVDVPGRFLLMDHSLSRALDKGALGALVVTGEGWPGVFNPLTPESSGRASGR
jgi:nitrite reductase (NO-forming)